MHRYTSVSFGVVLCLVALLGGACSDLTPEERVTQARARYEATLNGFVVQQRPLSASGEAMPETTEDGEPAEAVAGEASGEVEAPLDLSQDVLVDIVIRHDSFEKLAGITVDITMADGVRELQVWRVWFDTSGIEKGPGAQYSHTLEGVDYQPGYGFSAEIRSPVPPEERSEYREYAEAGS